MIMIPSLSFVETPDSHGLIYDASIYLSLIASEALFINSVVFQTLLAVAGKPMLNDYINCNQIFNSGRDLKST